jgi:hypothetical protein
MKSEPFSLSFFARPRAFWMIQMSNPEMIIEDIVFFCVLDSPGDIEGYAGYWVEGEDTGEGRIL